MHCRLHAFLFFLPFVLLMFRVISSPQRKQVIGRFLLIVARFAVCPITMSLLSASLRVTFSRLIFFFVALRADEPPGRPCNSASAACHFINVFIFNVGRCARSTVWNRSRAGQPMWMRQKYRISHTKGGPRSLGGRLHETGTRGMPGQFDVLFIRPRHIGRRGQRIDTYSHPPHDYVD